jgi:hypothetical protein
MDANQRRRAGRLDGGDANSRLRPEPPPDRRSERIAAAEQSLAEAYANARAAGIDPDSVNIAFAIARDCLAEAKECSEQARRELAMAQYERDQARRRRLHPARYSDTAARPVVPDVPDFDLCPDPGTVQTPTDFMDTLRMYRIWAGKPSYRVMERQCGRRFAASTIYTALQSNELPSLDMVQAIITACGGREEHRLAFASAWRHLIMPQQYADPAAQPPRARALYPVSETA